MPLPPAPRAAAACPARLRLACVPSASTPSACLRSPLAFCAPSSTPAQRQRAQPSACSPCRCCSGCIAIQHCLCFLPSHNTVNCIAIQSSLLPAFLPQYTRLYCDTVSALFSAIQTSVLQYTSSLQAFSHSPAIQFCKLYCNTISLVTRLQYTSILQYNYRLAILILLSQYNLDSSPKTVLHNFFFFIIISSSWKNT